jgi:long-chain acyl-CoA synthetase
VGKRHRQETVLDYLDRNAADHSGTAAIVDGDIMLTWSQYRHRARAVALSLIDLGVLQGQVVGLHMVNRVEHVISDLGVLLAGAIPTSYYNTLAEEQLIYLANDSAATVVIVDADQLPKWLAIWDDLPALRHLLVLDLDPDEPLPPGVLRYENWVDTAGYQLGTRGFEVDGTRAMVRSSDPLTIVYTSGTTGPPKGTVITHAAAVWVADSVQQLTEEHIDGVIPIGWTTVSYLPLAHITERCLTHYGALAWALTVHYVRDHAELGHVMEIAKPYIFFGVPRVWERIYGAIRECAATSASPVRRRLMATAISVAEQVGRARLGGDRAGLKARMLHLIMERVVYRKMRDVLGLDRLAIAVSGAARLAPEVALFFCGIGVLIVDIYGMTESCAVLTANPPGASKLGSVGKPLAGLELRISSAGEVLVKGPNITPGYINRPEATAEALDAAGWLHTGDVGFLDDDGYLTITGRKDDLINTASGKTLSPASVEVVLAQGSDLIGSVYVHGENKPCLVGLVALDPTAWQDWCAARGITVESVSEAVRNGRVRLEVAQSVGAGNAKLSRVEQVKNWALVDEAWSVQTGELTPTMKLKRPVIAERYRDEIEQLYDPLTIESWDN